MIEELQSPRDMVPTYSGTFAFLMVVRGAAALAPIWSGPTPAACITTLMASLTPGLSPMVVTAAGVLFPVRQEAPHVSTNLVADRDDLQHVATGEHDALLSWWSSDAGPNAVACVLHALCQMAAPWQPGLVSLAQHMLNSGVDRAALQRVLLNFLAQADTERSREQVEAARPTTAGDRRKWVSGERKACADADAFPWGAWPRDAAVTRTSKQAGKALRSQGHQYARVM